MSEVRWIARLGAPLVVASLAFAASGAPPGLGLVSLTAPAAPAARSLAACPAEPGAAGTPARGAAHPALGRRAWFTLTERLDARGTLLGWRFRSGPLAASPAIDVDVEAESFADGPDGGIVVLGHDDGTISDVDMIDAGSGCSLASATSRYLVRGAVRGAATGDMFVHRLDRVTRADLGVVRVRGDLLSEGTAVDIDAAADPAIPPLPADERFGPTWSTRMAASPDGRTFAVQSCGAIECRTRLLDVATGVVTTVDQPGQGELIGLTDGALVAWATCDSLPCPVVGIDTTTGATRTLADFATAAVLVRRESRTRVVVEEPEAGGWTLALVDPADGSRRTLPSPNGLRLRPHRGGRVEGADLPDGWLRLVPADSSGPAWGTGANAGLLLRTDDARTADPTTDPTEVR